MKLKLATAKFCGPCAQIKNKLKASSIEVETLDFETNADFFTKYNIKAVPRLVILDEEDNLIEMIQGIDDIIKKIKENAKD